MTALIAYALKVMLCSGILFLYYIAALRNRRYHQWNRFYLLAAALLSLLLPLVEVRLAPAAQPGQAVQMIEAVRAAGEYMDTVYVRQEKSWGAESLAGAGYLAVAIAFLLSFLVSLFRIAKLRNRYPSVRLDSVRFFLTRASGTPFSFFRSIFWNEAIDPESATGQQILEHEMVHVKERHSLDKIFFQLLLAFCWINPFFWLMRRELHMIHEFIADRQSVPDGDTAAFAAMILQAAYPGRYPAFANAFFHSPLKRRIRMLTNPKNPRLGYLGRLLVLPVLALLAFAFTIKRSPGSLIPLERDFTVVIDAGHGRMTDGQWNGARAGDHFEDQIVLSLAKIIAQTNRNQKLHIVLSRATDEAVDLKRRVQVAEESKADLFISLHMNAIPQGFEKDLRGFEVYLPHDNTPHVQQSRLAGSALVDELQNLLPVAPRLVQRTAAAYVLNKNVCPAVLIECGYITDNADRDYMLKADNQQKLAERILRAIERYANTASDIPQAAKLDRSIETDQVKKADGLPAEDTVPQKKATDRDASIDREAWQQHLVKNLQPVLKKLSQKVPNGAYTVTPRFKVNADGSLSDIRIEGEDYGVRDAIVNLVRQSPEWQPAIRNSQAVSSYHVQPITLVITDSKTAATTSITTTAAKLPVIPVADLKAKSIHELLKVPATDEVVSFTWTIDTDNGDIVTHEHSGPAFTESDRSFLEQHAKEGKLLTVEQIRVKRGGEMTKIPAKVYGL